MSGSSTCTGELDLFLQGKLIVDQLRVFHEATSRALNLTDINMEDFKSNAQKPYDFGTIYRSSTKIIVFPEEAVTDLVVVLLLLEIVRFLLRKGSEAMKPIVAIGS